MARTPLNEHCSAVLLKKLPKKLGDPCKFLIPCDFPGMAECLALADLGASINLMPFSVCKRLSLPNLTPTCMTLDLADHLISRLVRVAEDVYVKVGSFHFSADFVVVDFDVDPRVPLILERSFLKTRRALIDVFEGELTLRVSKEAITFNLDQTSRYSANYSDMMAKHIDIIDMACEECSQEVLGFPNTIWSENHTPYYDLIVSATSPTVTPFGNSDFLFEEVDAFLAIEDEPTSFEFHQSYLDPEGYILLLEAFLNDDPSLPPPNQRNYLPEVRKELRICKANSDKSSVNEPPVVELKDLPPHLEYAFLEGGEKLPVIILKDLKDFKLAVQHKRRVNPKIHDVIKQEVIKLLEAGLIYPIFDSPLVSPVHCVPKKGGFTVVENEDNELIVTRLVTGTFQRCMMEIFYDMIEKTMEEKSHFMVKEGIVLGYEISKQGIEVAKEKVDVITKLPHPTTVKECVDSFQTLKRKLTEAPILIALNWDMPLELMCDASDFAIGAVLGQRQDKHFRPIHYVSKTMIEAESNYTTTEKEMLAVVAIISDRGTHCNDQFTKVMQKYGVPHRLATPYHSQTSGQVEVSNRGLKRILEWAVGENRVSCSDQLDDAFWAFRTAYKTPIGCTPYKLVYGKSCHLPVELEHKAYWALKHANFDLKRAGDHRKVQINELNELRDQAYENSLIYTEKSKRIHESKIKNHVFNIGNRDLFFNSRLKIFSGKLKSRWSGPFTISQVYPYGTVELSQPDGPNFKVNGHRLKHYFGEDVPKLVVPDL
nr:reverse transcriptase domain-containing protein [Tanacetum cinerariifolium]